MIPDLALHKTWEVYRLIAQNMSLKLGLTKSIPKNILIIGADADISVTAIKQYYPKASIYEVDDSKEYLKISAQNRLLSNLKLREKLLGLNIKQLLLPYHTSKQTVSLLWSNLYLLRTIPPYGNIFRNWANQLSPQGLIFFSHLGLDSFKEVKQILLKHGISVHFPTLVDIHDLGDELLQSQFTDPVIDTDRIKLNYQNPNLFWQDMYVLGLHTLQKHNEADRIKEIIDHAFASQELTQITLEIIYGHAMKKNILNNNETIVQFIPSKTTTSSSIK